MTTQEIMERIDIMIRTGCSQETVVTYATKLYGKGIITSRGYELLISIIEENFI